MSTVVPAILVLDKLNSCDKARLTGGQSGSKRKQETQIIQANGDSGGSEKQKGFVYILKGGPMEQNSPQSLQD